MEATAKIDAFVFDKTGTLTRGTPQVEGIILFDLELKETDFLRMIASAELYSEHSLGKAVIAFARSRGSEAVAPDSFEMTTGRGVIASVNGVEIRIGEKAIGEDVVNANREAAVIGDRMWRQGKTVLPVARDGIVIGLVSTADSLRKEARATIVKLKATGFSRIVMLTGDNRSVAESVGQAAGITEIFAPQLPEDKVNTIKDLSGRGYRVGMLGDGVNDAPALATASVGIVMSSIGSDVAMEAADIALMNDDISKLPFLIDLSRKTRNRIIFNIVISMLINFGAIICAGFGWLNPVTVAIVHNFGSVFVVFNSAMLLAYKE